MAQQLKQPKAGMVNQEEFLALVNEHRAMLHKVCNIYCHSETDRQDMFQEIVIQLWRAYPNFRGDSKFSTWLYRIALNTAISDLRRQQRRVKMIYPETVPYQLPAETRSTEEEEQLQQLYKAISHLEEIDRAIVMLYLEDKGYDEMEEILGINQNNLRVKMNRIKEKLRKLTKAVEHGVG
jgi:RNA polymerase sigma-70 factor, ECF subfamily